jgi:hypothetical protein
MLSSSISLAVNSSIVDYKNSRLRQLVDEAGAGKRAIKFVGSEWAANYATPKQLKISETPALTWGTGTYVTPLAFPLSSVLYGRVGLVADFDPEGWRIFDATEPTARTSYMRWAQVQPNFEDLVLTVHSTFTNHKLRDRFRRDFRIDCVLFHPDQEAELHTDRSEHVWMLVTDWLSNSDIDPGMSKRLANARFTVLIDEEFNLSDAGLPVQTSARKIETTTLRFPNAICLPVSYARGDPTLGAKIAQQYVRESYLHVFVEP